MKSFKFVCLLLVVQGWQPKFDEWVELNSWRVAAHHMHTAVTNRERKSKEKQRMMRELDEQEEEQEDKQEDKLEDKMEVEQDDKMEDKMEDKQEEDLVHMDVDFS